MNQNFKKDDYEIKEYTYCAPQSRRLALSSCTGNFLDEDRNPNSLDPENFWKSESDILKGLTAAYAGLQPTIEWAQPFERYIVIDNYRSDELDYRPRRDRLDGTGHVQQRIDQLRAQR